MRALTVVPGRPNSAVVADVAEPDQSDGDLLAETLAVGVCGTDLEIVAGKYGWAPPGHEALTIGHEAVGRVLEAPHGDFNQGDLIVPIVRRPDPEPCAYCRAGEWDMCRNGRYTERGIKERDGYASERFRVESGFAVPVPLQLGRLAILVEPASVVAKAWEHAERIGQRSRAWQPTTALVTGAGPIGLLAALLGRQRGLDVHVFDRVTTGPKPDLVRDLGATYHGGELSVVGDLAPDITIECTGATPVLADVVTRSAPSGIVCLAGVSSGGHEITFDIGEVNRRIVLENDVIFGSVNANRRHYHAAVAALGRADIAWLERLITRWIPLDRWRDALVRQADDVKTAIAFAGNDLHAGAGAAGAGQA